MALLLKSEKVNLLKDFMSETSRLRKPTGAVLKPDLTALVNAIDQWLETNAASFNQALPEPAKSVLGKKMKYEVFSYVLKRRLGVM